MRQLLKIILLSQVLMTSVATTQITGAERPPNSPSVPWSEKQLKIAQKITGLSNDSLSLLLKNGSPLAGKLTDAVAAVAVVDDLLAARDLSAMTSARDAVLDKLIGQFAAAKGLERFAALLTAFKVYKASLEIVHDHWWTPALQEEIYARYNAHRPQNAVWQKRETMLQATGSKYHALRDDWYDKLVKEKGYDKKLIGPVFEQKLRNDIDRYWMSYLETRYQREKLLEETKGSRQPVLDALLRRQRDEFSYMLVVRAVDAKTGESINRFTVEADSDKGKEAIGSGRNGTAVLNYLGSSKHERGDARLHYGVWEITVSAKDYQPVTTACIHRPDELTVCTVQLGDQTQRVLVEYEVTTSEEASSSPFRWKGSCEATVSFDGDQVVLAFDLATDKVEGAPDNMDESDRIKVEEDVSVWKGTISDDGILRFQGKAEYRSKWRETGAPNQVGYARFGGDVSARMKGKALIGTLKAQGETKSTRAEATWIKHDFSFHINNFPVPAGIGQR